MRKQGARRCDREDRSFMKKIIPIRAMNLTPEQRKILGKKFARAQKRHFKGRDYTGQELADFTQEFRSKHGIIAS